MSNFTWTFIPFGWTSSLLDEILPLLIWITVRRNFILIRWVFFIPVRWTFFLIKVGLTNSTRLRISKVFQTQCYNIRFGIPSESEGVYCLLNRPLDEILSLLSDLSSLLEQLLSLSDELLSLIDKLSSLLDEFSSLSEQLSLCYMNFHPCLTNYRNVR